MCKYGVVLFVVEVAFWAVAENCQFLLKGKILTFTIKAKRWSRVPVFEVFVFNGFTEYGLFRTKMGLKSIFGRKMANTSCLHLKVEIWPFLCFYCCLTLFVTVVFYHLTIFPLQYKRSVSQWFRYDLAGCSVYLYQTRITRPDPASLNASRGCGCNKMQH